MPGGRGTEDLLRRLAPQVLGALVRRYGHFDTAEDAVQEALLAATVQWPRDGAPADPRGWLITVASRKLTDLLRSEQARQRREDTVARQALPGQWAAPAAGQADPTGADDTLILLFLCCHPALSPASQIALTLRAVGGLSTAEIARAFLVPEATMTRRISRAKQGIRASGEPFSMPAAGERAERLAAVLHVLYLIFNEGYASTSGPDLQRVELAAEAIRLARLLHRLLPGDGEVTGLLALMLLTDARRPARTGPHGELVPMAEQDRSRWDAAAIAEGVALITAALPHGPTGPYQLQAAIAAVHDEAPSAGATDWPQIMALYEVLLRISDNPVVTLNHAVAVAMVRGPQAGLDLLAGLESDERITRDHRLPAVRGHLLEMSGDRAAARDCYQAAARRALSLPQQRYLQAQATRLAGD
jgi:RNA polymerase sigma factor (sigma-70 family)